jgi:hypothetical protein
MFIRRTADELLRQRQKDQTNLDLKIQRRIESQLKQFIAKEAADQGFKPATLQLHFAAIRSFFEIHYYPLKMRRGDYPTGESLGVRAATKDMILKAIENKETRNKAEAISRNPIPQRLRLTSKRCKETRLRRCTRTTRTRRRLHTNNHDNPESQDNRKNLHRQRSNPCAQRIPRRKTKRLKADTARNNHRQIAIIPYMGIAHRSKDTARNNLNNCKNCLSKNRRKTPIGTQPTEIPSNKPRSGKRKSELDRSNPRTQTNQQPRRIQQTHR